LSVPFLFVALLGLGIFIYVRTHPLVFNESFLGHAHCILQVDFRSYAEDHNGVFPVSSTGYGDALVLMSNYAHWSSLTGPGYNGGVFLSAFTNQTHAPESECGRVYVQGLTTNSNPEIAIFFDKLATAGGDHCHFHEKLFASMDTAASSENLHGRNLPGSKSSCSSKKVSRVSALKRFTRKLWPERSSHVLPETPANAYPPAAGDQLPRVHAGSRNAGRTV
jgi:hypothetical protein